MVHGQVSGMEAFYDLSPLVAFYTFPSVPPPVCVCHTHAHVCMSTQTHQESQGAVGVCQVLHSSQLNLCPSEPNSILMQDLFFFSLGLNIYEKPKPKAD